MTQYIDQDYWWDILSRPDWYLYIADEFKKLEDMAKNEDRKEVRKEIKRGAYEIVEKALAEEHIPLAESGDDLDAERKPIDTVVIHHTKNPAGMSLDRLNAMQLLRIYGMYYANPADDKKSLRGQAVWSNHFYKDKQVFWCYHWLIREGGKAERILEDNNIGWHAGNWKINTRSVAICIDDDLSDRAPSNEVLQSIAALIKSNYSQIKAGKIIGHRDANPKTECPGSLFTEWHERLIQMVG